MSCAKDRLTQGFVRECYASAVRLGGDGASILRAVLGLARPHSSSHLVAFTLKVSGPEIEHVAAVVTGKPMEIVPVHAHLAHAERRDTSDTSGGLPLDGLRAGMVLGCS